MVDGRRALDRALRWGFLAGVAVAVAVSGLWGWAHLKGDAGAEGSLIPMVAKDERTRPGMNPVLRERWVDARLAAAAEGIPMRIASGARSLAEQEALVAAAAAASGAEDEDRGGDGRSASSETRPDPAAEAVEWIDVSESRHTRGLAIDIEPPDGVAWLIEHGWKYGLCQVYLASPSHFEPLVDRGQPCPPAKPGPADW
jgi:hypothetical protein